MTALRTVLATSFCMDVVAGSTMAFYVRIRANGPELAQAGWQRATLRSPHQNGAHVVLLTLRQTRPCTVGILLARLRVPPHGRHSATVRLTPVTSAAAEIGDRPLYLVGALRGMDCMAEMLELAEKRSNSDERDDSGCLSTSSGQLAEFC
eukprot:CAMPEP_0115319086 /NCGR_PEP_ID=MMETSP0270-20121206/79558_1 /TAXON_ID=71861 /ORGANISM="Scrippsiella trochoidea, Strain CCMP3099" /LENGTH=149 /DNA_ID=CAMNT_0002738715 /DNA_START=404 /DNA_END=854 /DNA_ORIENTATION=+